MTTTRYDLMRKEARMRADKMLCKMESVKLDYNLAMLEMQHIELAERNQGKEDFDNKTLVKEAKEVERAEILSAINTSIHLLPANSLMLGGLDHAASIVKARG